MSPKNENQGINGYIDQAANSTSNVYHSTKDKLHDINESARELANGKPESKIDTNVDSAAESAKSTLHSTEDSIHNAKENIGNKTEEMKGWIKGEEPKEKTIGEQATEIVNSAMESMNSAIEAAKTTIYGKEKDGIDETVDNTASATKDGLHYLKDTADSTSESIQNAFKEEEKDKVDEAIEKAAEKSKDMIDSSKGMDDRFREEIKQPTKGEEFDASIMN